MLKSEHEELIALREHVYNMTEEDIVLQEKNRRELIASVIDKRIVIVGGHKNWVQKMRDVFPNWKYIDFKSVMNCLIRKIHIGLIFLGIDV